MHDVVSWTYTLVASCVCIFLPAACSRCVVFGGMGHGLAWRMVCWGPNRTLCNCGPPYVASTSCPHQRQAWADQASNALWGAIIKTVACARHRCFALENVFPITNNLNSDVVDIAVNKLSDCGRTQGPSEVKKEADAYNIETQTHRHTDTLDKSVHHNSSLSL